MLEKWLITIPELTGDEQRYAYVYVPDNYDENTRFPVLYMFDGHNLFDDAEASYGKSWGMLEFMENNNVPLIIAAIECNHHPETDECGGRLSEYSPFDFYDRHWGDIKGRGKITMDYIVNDFKPFIDENYPTLPGRDNTLISGSSMGGLMTIYAVMEYNDTFSKGAALSPSIGFGPKKVGDIIKKANLSGKTMLYMDYGEYEFKSHYIRKSFNDTCGLLLYKNVLLDARIVPEGTHSEASWEKQIPFFLSTLLY